MWAWKQKAIQPFVQGWSASLPPLQHRTSHWPIKFKLHFGKGQRNTFPVFYNPLSENTKCLSCTTILLNRICSKYLNHIDGPKLWTIYMWGGVSVSNLIVPFQDLTTKHSLNGLAEVARLYSFNFWISPLSMTTASVANLSISEGLIYNIQLSWSNNK